jgi:hypothetical protein
MDQSKLRESLVWGRLYLREAQREFAGKPNDAMRLAEQLREQTK